MSGQPPYFDPQIADGLRTALEVMTAVVEGYEHNGVQPDTSLADYITGQSTGELPPAVWTLVSGFVNLSHGFLGEIAGQTGESKQAVLDRWAEATTAMTAPKANPAGK